ncbi:MAG: hypothetical protein LUG98_09685 [Tannerellaceae bacterium]|nr:hypothetical protein [Tannerellaceae bacterium]
MKIRPIATLLVILLISSVTGCREKTEETVDLAATRQDIISYFDQYIPRIMPIRTEIKDQILDAYLAELDAYQAIDTVVPIHYFVDHIIGLSFSYVFTDVFIPGPRQQLFLEKSEDMFYEMAKDNHLKTHPSLKGFPGNSATFMQWVAEIWVNRTALVQQVARAAALLQELEQAGKIDPTTVENFLNLLNNDIDYFTGNKSNTSLVTQRSERTRSTFRNYPFDPATLQALEEIYGEIEVLARKEIPQPFTDVELLVSDPQQYNAEELALTYFTYLYDRVENGETSEEDFLYLAQLLQEDMDFMQNLLISQEELATRVLHRLAEFEEMQLPLIEKELLANIYYTAATENGLDLLPQIQDWLQNQHP